MGQRLAAAGPVIEVDNLTVSFGRLKAVEDVSLSVQMGEVYAIVGESGCGKVDARIFADQRGPAARCH